MIGAVRNVLRHIKRDIVAMPGKHVPRAATPISAPLVGADDDITIAVDCDF